MTNRIGAALRFVPSNGLDIDLWTQRYRDGDVPGEWPYGLNALRSHGFELSWTKTKPVNAVDVVRALVRRHSGGDGQAFSWDERGALRMIAQGGAAQMFSGVIWATDRAAFHPRSLLTHGLLRKLSGAWVLSSAQLEPLRSMVPSRIRPFVGLVQFGVDTEFFANRPLADDDETIVVSAGRDRDRDFQTLLRAVPLVRRHIPNAKFVIQSRSPMALPEGCTLLSEVTHREMRELYVRSTAVVVPTRPNLHVSGMTVALEAMATGRAVLLGRTPGIGDYLPDDREYSYPVGDANALADRLTEVLRDRGLAARAGSDGARYVRRNHTLRNMAESFDRLFSTWGL